MSDRRITKDELRAIMGLERLNHQRWSTYVEIKEPMNKRRRTNYDHDANLEASKKETQSVSKPSAAKPGSSKSGTVVAEAKAKTTCPKCKEAEAEAEAEAVPEPEPALKYPLLPFVSSDRTQPSGNPLRDGLYGKVVRTRNINAVGPRLLCVNGHLLLVTGPGYGWECPVCQGAVEFLKRGDQVCYKKDWVPPPPPPPPGRRQGPSARPRAIAPKRAA